MALFAITYRVSQGNDGSVPFLHEDLTSHDPIVEFPWYTVNYARPISTCSYS
jgi:hypothetical protein